MSKNKYVSGQWNLICDICGKKIKAGEAKHRWDGFVVCERDFEHRHSQDFVRARQDKISVPFTRPRPVDSFRELISYQDTIIVSDDDHADDYFVYDVSNKYFLEDYILDPIAFTITMKWNRPFEDTITIVESCDHQLTKPFTDSVSILDSVFIGSVYRSSFSDTVTTSDTGTIFQTTYVDGTYFSEQYVGTIYTF
jgi:hypothetical protein